MLAAQDLVPFGLLGSTSIPSTIFVLFVAPAPLPPSPGDLDAADHKHYAFGHPSIGCGFVDHDLSHVFASSYD